MPECKYCHQNRNELKNGLCILCTRGPGGKPVEVKATNGIQYRGKVIKTSSKEDLAKQLGLSIGNRGVWKKEKRSNL